MATITAQATGNWSATGTWAGGVVPTTGDTARPSTFTVTIDQDITVALLEGHSSGHFAVTAARTITAAVTSSTGHSGGGVVRCSHTSGTVTITGAVTAGPNVGVAASGAGGNYVIIGNVVGGSGSGSYGYHISAAIGTSTITGNVTGGSGTTSYGVYANAACGAISITGNVAGGSSGNGVLNNNNAVSISITGNVTGGSGGSVTGVSNNVNGTILVSGSATGGSAAGAIGASNVAAGTLRVGTAIGNDYGPSGTATGSATGLQGSNNASAITTYRALQFGDHGQAPVGQCAYLEVSSGNNTAKVYDTASTFIVLTNPGVAQDFPSIANVRSGTTYGSGTYTGTLAVPAANQVSVGVAVDNTTGTAVLTATAAENAVWNAVRSSHTTDGTYGDTAEWAGGGTPPTAAAIRAEIDSNSTQLAKLGTPAGASISADIAAVKAETASIQTDTNDLQAQIGTAGAGLTVLATQASVNTIDDFLDTEVAAIKAKTDNLPAAPAAVGDIPAASAIVTAIMAYAVESGHSVETVLEALYAIVRGKFIANDETDPTSIAYYAPDNSTVRVTHTISGATRTVA